MRNYWSIERDFDDVLYAVGDDWQKYRGARIFITGGTGFIGRWLLESLRYADIRLKLGVSATILTRNIDGFRGRALHLYDYPSFSFVSGDVRDFEYPSGQYSHLIHAATDASAQLNELNPLLMFDTIVSGCKHVLNFAAEKKINNILNLSSGAVYGAQPWELTHVREDWPGAVHFTNPLNAYAEGKRASEMLCAIFAKQFQLKITSARIFAVIGPYLPLNNHFAAGNFIRDAISGQKIIIASSGKAVRSYLYAADLTTALWRLLAQEPEGHIYYNVGSDQPISIKELAERVSAVIGNHGYEVNGASDGGWNPGRYVPDVGALAQKFGPINKVTLDESILRTAIWNGWNPW